MSRELRKDIELDVVSEVHKIHAREAEAINANWYTDNPTPSRLGEALREKSRELRDDMRVLAEGGAFYSTKALKELREACADLARMDDTDLDARIERVDTCLDRYQISRPDWEAIKE